MRSLLLAAALPLLGSAEAHAVPGYCTAGSLNACASVVVEKTGDVVVIRVTNLQGYDLADNTWYSGIWGFDLFAPGLTGASGLSTTFAGGAYAEASYPGWSVFTPTAGWVRVWGSSSAGNITGCNEGDVPLGGSAGRYHTCGSGAWIEFTFSTQGQWDLNQAHLGWGAHVMGSQSSQLQSVYCDSRSGASCATMNTTLAQTPPTGNVTPEPISMVLLGTGLAGVGAAARRRRRRAANQTV